VLCRFVAEGLQPGYNRSVIVETRSGASGQIAVSTVKAAPAPAAFLPPPGYGAALSCRTPDTHRPGPAGSRQGPCRARARTHLVHAEGASRLGAGRSGPWGPVVKSFGFTAESWVGCPPACRC